MLEYFHDDAMRMRAIMPSDKEPAQSISTKLGREAADITVWTGDHNRKVADGERNHTVCGITLHPQYEGQPLMNNDIAILHLCQPITVSAGKVSQQAISTIYNDH